MSARPVLFDTSVLIAGVESPQGGPEAISVISVGELEHGILATRSRRTRTQRLAELADLLAEVPVLPVDRRVAASYGELRHASGRQPSNDLWIAATALAHGFTLLTADERQAGLPLVQAKLVQ